MILAAQNVFCMARAWVVLRFPPSKEVGSPSPPNFQDNKTGTSRSQVDAVEVSLIFFFSVEIPETRAECFTIISSSFQLLCGLRTRVFITIKRTLPHPCRVSRIPATRCLSDGQFRLGLDWKRSHPAAEIN